ncbi:MAG: cytochrome C oxidase subunit IV family protein [Terriglobales bacterium]
MSSQHILPRRTYFLVFLALEVLTVVTALVASIDLGAANTVVALCIAVTKSTLVVLFFMHVKYSSKMTKLTVILGVFWLMILLGMTMTDYVSRLWSTVR